MAIYLQERGEASQVLQWTRMRSGIFGRGLEIALDCCYNISTKLPGRLQSITCYFLRNNIVMEVLYGYCKR